MMMKKFWSVVDSGSSDAEGVCGAEGSSSGVGAGAGDSGSGVAGAGAGDSGSGEEGAGPSSEPEAGGVEDGVSGGAGSTCGTRTAKVVK